MKATTNMTRIAKTGIVSVALLCAAYLVPVQAASDNSSSMDMTEVQAATDRLEAFTFKTENELKFNAPVLNENASELFELEAAEARLNELYVSIEESTKYVSPEVSEGFEAYDLYLAVENLEQMTIRTEQMLKFNVSLISE
jgi:predicted secreted protein